MSEPELSQREATLAVLSLVKLMLDERYEDANAYLETFNRRDIGGMLISLVGIYVSQVNASANRDDVIASLDDFIASLLA